MPNPHLENHKAPHSSAPKPFPKQSLLAPTLPASAHRQTRAPVVQTAAASNLAKTNDPALGIMPAPHLTLQKSANSKNHPALAAVLSPSSLSFLQDHIEQAQCDHEVRALAPSPQTPFDANDKRTLDPLQKTKSLHQEKKPTPRFYFYHPQEKPPHASRSSHLVKTPRNSSPSPQVRQPHDLSFDKKPPPQKRDLHLPTLTNIHPPHPPLA